MVRGWCGTWKISWALIGQASFLHTATKWKLGFWCKLMYHNVLGTIFLWTGATSLNFKAKGKKKKTKKKTTKLSVDFSILKYLEIPSFVGITYNFQIELHPVSLPDLWHFSGFQIWLQFMGLQRLRHNWATEQQRRQIWLLIGRTQGIILESLFSGSHWDLSPEIYIW